MNCERWLPALLEAAADDRLDDVSRSDREGLMAHLEQCAECRLALQEQRDVRAALAARADAEAPAGFSARVLSEIDLGPSASLSSSLSSSSSWVDMLRWRIWTYRLVPVATVLLLLGIVTARSSPEQIESAVGLSELAESWAFGDDEAPPAFTLWGQEDVAGDLLLDAILSAEPDDTLSGGDPS
jgi:anti-sigma factor RsiW